MICQQTVISGSHLNAKGHDNVGKSGKENTNKIISWSFMSSSSQEDDPLYMASSEEEDTITQR